MEALQGKKLVVFSSNAVEHGQGLKDFEECQLLQLQMRR